MNKKVLRIDIVSDVVCPWCIIGYKRLEKALELLKDDIDAEIYWHPFELNTSMPEGGENLRQHLAQKYGTTPEGSIAARKRLTDLGADLGFTFNYYDDMNMYNTFKAHQLIHWAKEKGKQTELKLKLFAAFFAEKKEIDQTDILVTVAGEVGLDTGEARHILENATYSDTVRTEINEWTSRGIHGVPAFIFNNTYMITGAQEVEAFTTHIPQMFTDT